jgi:hypothetical protein
VITSPHLGIQNEQLRGYPEGCLRPDKSLDDNCLAATRWPNNHCAMSGHQHLVGLRHFLYLQTAIFLHLHDCSEIFHCRTVHVAVEIHFMSHNRLEFNMSYLFEFQFNLNISVLKIVISENM